MFLSTAPRSTHEKALYSLTEHLAYNNDDTMDDVGEAWYKKYGLFETDYYEYFPDHLRPTDRAFIFAGTGGSSTLHVDAYNWTGWNGAFVVRPPPKPVVPLAALLPGLPHASLERCRLLPFCAS